MTKERFLETVRSYMTDGNRHCVRIYGHGGSGKSHFARELCQLLDADEVNLLETEPYIISGQYRDMVVPKDSPHQKVTACLPLAHEINSLTRDIRSLSAGLDILTIDEPWSPSRILPAYKPILLVEGLSAAFLPENLFDLFICFYTDDETELERRLERDSKLRNRSIDFIQATHEARRKQYEDYYKPYEKSAHILVNQSQNGFQIEKDSVLKNLL